MCILPLGDRLERNYTWRCGLVFGDKVVWVYWATSASKCSELRKRNRARTLIQLDYPWNQLIKNEEKLLPYQKTDAVALITYVLSLLRLSLFEILSCFEIPYAICYNFSRRTKVHWMQNKWSSLLEKQRIFTMTLRNYIMRNICVRDVPCCDPKLRERVKCSSTNCNCRPCPNKMMKMLIQNVALKIQTRTWV